MRIIEKIIQSLTYFCSIGNIHGRKGLMSFKQTSSFSLSAGSVQI